MKSKQEIKEWLLTNCINEYGILDLSGLEFELYVDFSHIKTTKKIYNNNQKAKTINNSNHNANQIYNSRQNAKYIINENQKAKTINNNYQNADKIENWSQTQEEYTGDK